MRLFISFHTADQPFAERLQGRLVADRPDLWVFFAPERITAGAYWLPSLEQEIINCDAFVIILGKAVGPWQELEYATALSRWQGRGPPGPGARGKPRIIPVRIVPDAPGLPFLHLLQHLQAEARDVDAVTGSSAAFFFGRENLAADSLLRIADRPPRVLTLIGNSGVGKSSLAHAGVLARLRSQIWPIEAETWPESLGDSRAWLPIVVQPGDTL